MKDIKRYKIDLECRDKINQWGRNLLLDDTNGNLVKYADHKEVVETMQNKIDELEKDRRVLKSLKYWMVERFRRYRNTLETIQDTLDRDNDLCDDTKLLLAHKKEWIRLHNNDVKSKFKFEGFDDLR